MKQKRVLAIIGRIFMVIAALVVGIRVYFWNAQNLLGNQMPMPFGYGAAIVLSGSMEPAYSVDDLLFIKETGSYEPNDVVVFQTGDSSVVHRIVQVDGSMVITQGDANNVADDPIDMADIKGEVIGCIPGIGSFIRMLKTPVGMIGLFAIAICLTEYSYRKDKEADSDELKKMREEILALKKEMEQEVD